MAIDEGERAGPRVAQAPVESGLLTSRRGFFWVGVEPPFNPVFGPGSFAWGLASAPLTYDPPAVSPADLRLTAEPPAAPGRPARILQAAPARRLAHLARVPIAVVTGEASVFNQSDPIVVDVLRQAGCRVDHLRLVDHGVRGNGHAMMLERNSREVLDVLLAWTTGQVAAGGAGSEERR